MVSCYGQITFFFLVSLNFFFFLQEKYELLELWIACYSDDNYEQKNVNISWQNGEMKAEIQTHLCLGPQQ